MASRPSKTLEPGERTRALQFRFRMDRERFVVGRGTLRSILGHYLDVEPRQLRFNYTSHGKPFLTNDGGDETLCFNVSHSGGLGLYAVTRNRQVGVDLEYINRDQMDEQVAGRFFSPIEFATFRSLPVSSRRIAFFSCWTRKEAYIKANGKGLSIPLDEFDVSLRPGEPAELMSTAWDPKEASSWSMRDVCLPAGYVGAVCAEGSDWRLRCWQWHE